MIDNAVGATMYLNADGTTTIGYYSFPDGLGGSATLTNEGSIVKSAGTATTTVSFAIENFGSVSAQSGTVSFTGGSPAGQAPASGSWGSTGSGSLGLDGRAFDLGSTNLSGQVEISGAVTATDVQAPTGHITVDSQFGEPNLSVTSTSTVSHVAHLVLTGGGILGGTGEIDVSGSLDWSSPGWGVRGGGDPVMTGTGSMVILPGATASLSFINASVGDLENGWMLRNEGTLTLRDGAVEAFGSGEAIDNAAGATMDLNADGNSTIGYNTWPNGITLPQSYNGPASSATLTNEGSITKASGTDTTTVGLPIENTGSVSAQSGTLSFTDGSLGGVAAASGSWGSTGSGAVALGGGTFALGSMSVAGQLNVDGGQVTATDVQGPTGSLGVTSGGLTITSTSVVSTVAGLSLSGYATLGGAGELDVAGSLSWSSASSYDQAAMSGPGSTVILPGATATLAFAGSEGELENGRTLRNEGTLTLSAGALAAVDAGERIDNAIGATMYLNADGSTPIGYSAYPNGLGGTGSPATLTNEGSIIKAAGTGTTTIALAIENAGLVSAQSGTLSLTGGTPAGVAPMAGSWGSADSGAVGLDAGTFALGSMSVAGQLNVYGGQVTATDVQAPQGSVTVGGSAMYSSGTLTTTSPSTTSHIADLTLTNGGTLAGAGEVDVSGSLEWSSIEGGYPTMSGSGSTVIEPGAAATLDFNSSDWFSYGVLTGGRSLVNEGTMTLADGVLFAYGVGDSIDNRAGGVINLTADGTTPALSYGGRVQDGIELGVCYYACSSESASLTNEGQIIKPSGTGTTEIGLPIDNEGTVDAQAGRIDFAGGGHPVVSGLRGPAHARQPAAR